MRVVVQHRSCTLFNDLEDGGHGQHEAVRVLKWRKVHITHALCKRGQHALRKLQREPRLATTADAGQREQARLGQQAFQFGQVVFVADETSELRREVVSPW